MIDLRRQPQPLPLPVRGAAFGVVLVFVGVGTAQAVADRPAAALVGVVLALAGSAASLFGPAVSRLPAALVGLGGAAAMGTGEASDICWFAVCVLAGWLVLSLPLRLAALFWVIAVLVLAGEAAFASRDWGWAAWLAGTTFSVLGSLGGQAQRALVVELREAQAGLAARAQTEERARIARELHDVIAHSLTVSLLHVTSARLAVRDDPAAAEGALADAERLGRQSLDEVRHAVGLLRTGADPTAPLPGSADVPALVDRFRRAGTEVDLHLDGDLTALPGVVGLAAHRIVQEALTNAVRHAPSWPARVRLAVREHEVTIDVETAGAPGPLRADGHGLAGMRERAATLGGTCTAGPGGAGWLVHAELPLATATAPALP